MAFNIAVSVFHLLPKFMAQELAAGASAIGGVVSVFGLAMLGSVPFVGRLLDGARNRAVLQLGCALMTASALGFLWVDHVGPLLFTLRAVQAVSLSMCINAGSAITAALAPPGRLAQALGLYTSAGMLMNALGPALAEFVAERWSFAPSFAIAGGAAALALVLALRMPFSSPRTVRGSDLRQLMRGPNALRMITILSVTGLGFGAMFSFSQPFALALGIPNVRGFFLAFTLGAVFVRVGLGPHLDRLGHQRVSFVSLLGYGAVVAAMYWLAPGRLEIFGALFGLTHGLFMPAFTALVISGAASRDHGMLLTLFNGAFNVGNCLVYLLGVAAERLGYPVVFASTGGLLLLMPVLLRAWPASAVAAARGPCRVETARPAPSASLL